MSSNIFSINQITKLEDKGVKISPKVKIYTNHLNWRVFSWGRGGGGKKFGVKFGVKKFGPFQKLNFQQLSHSQRFEVEVKIYQIVLKRCMVISADIFTVL